LKIFDCLPTKQKERRITPPIDSVEKFADKGIHGQLESKFLRFTFSKLQRQIRRPQKHKPSPKKKGKGRICVFSLSFILKGFFPLKIYSQAINQFPSGFSSAI
jgi:hypothetical protein